jgi:outer membrane receptor for ferrienterochelin and colicins
MRKLAASSALVATLIASAAARAESLSDLDALLAETVSTTAAKSAQESSTAPALSINVTAEDLRRYGVRNLAEAYNFLAVGIVAQDPLGDVDVGSRGVLMPNDRGRHILLLIDGHITNQQLDGASFHNYATGIPIEIIDHLEIILGPGSVLYGSNAMLGVVNVITRAAKGHAGVNVTAETSLSSPLTSSHQPVSPGVGGQYWSDLGKAHRVSAGIGETFELFGKRGEITTQLEYRDFDGPMFGWKPQITPNQNFGPRAPFGTWGGKTRSSYYEQMPSGYLRARLGEFQLTLHGVGMHSSVPYTRLGDPPADFDDPESYRKRTYGAVDLTWSKNVSQAVSLTSHVFADFAEQSAQVRVSRVGGCPDTLVGVGCTRATSGQVQWIGAEVQSSLRWLEDGSLTSLLGLTGLVRGVGFSGNVRHRITDVHLEKFGAYDATETQGAIYLQQEYRPGRIFAFNAGARWDLDSRFGQRISPRAAASANVWRGGTFKVIYAEAFRAPTAAELHFTDPYLVLASPSLNPETVRSAEAILQQRFGSHRITYGIYRSWWQNMVFRRTLTDTFDGTPGAETIRDAKSAGLIYSHVFSVVQDQNLATIDDYGLNAAYEGTAFDERLSFGANATASYARVQIPEGAQRMTVIPGMYGNARVAYRPDPKAPTVALAAHMSERRLVDAFNGLRDSYRDTSAPILYAPPSLDLRLTVTGPIGFLPGLKYRAMGDYAFTTSNPYIVGPNARNRPEDLVPVNRLTVMLGLSYEFQLKEDK